MSRFAVVMITKDRTPKTNYLASTLQNLARAGVFESSLLSSFSIFDSGSESTKFILSALGEINGRTHLETTPRTPTENASRALRFGSMCQAPWVLFLEDDIDVCARFLESAAAWLDDHGDGYRVFPLGANYSHINSCRDKWPYPVDKFYGTIAVAMRRSDARSIADYLDAHPSPTYDLHMTAWAQERGITHFLTPAPSFVQHIGAESIIRPGSDPITYQTWSGRDWAYSGNKIVGVL